jgi:hypothetical protein
LTKLNSLALPKEESSKNVDELLKKKLADETNSPSLSQQDRIKHDVVYLSDPIARQSEVSIQLNNAIIAISVDAIDGFYIGRE